MVSSTCLALVSASGSLAASLLSVIVGWRPVSVKKRGGFDARLPCLVDLELR